MEVLASMDVAAIKVAIWATSAVVGVLVLVFGIYRIKFKTKGQYAWATAKSILVSSLTFAACSLLAMAYIASHPTDRRWSEGKKPMIESGQIGGGTFFQDFVAPLNDVKNTAVDAANNVIAIENAFATLPEFLVMLLWAAGIAVVFGLPMTVVAGIQKRQMTAQYRVTKAVVDAHNAAIQDLQRRGGVDERDILPNLK